MKEQIKKALETYNKFAKIYADHTSNKILQFQLNKFISLLPKDPKVLDVGAGTGRDLKYFKEEGINAIGIDVSEGLIKEAKKRNNIEIQNMDFRKTTFKDESFDGLWCMAALSDISRSEVPETLKEFNRILKKEGIIYIAVKEGTEEKLMKKSRYGNEARFYSFYKQAELELLLKESNFEIINGLTSQDSLTSWVEIFAKKL